MIQADQVVIRAALRGPRSTQRGFAFTSTGVIPIRATSSAVQRLKVAGGPHDGGTPGNSHAVIKSDARYRCWPPSRSPTAARPRLGGCVTSHNRR